VRTRSIWVAWSLLAAWTAVVAVLVTLSAVNGTFRPDALTDSVPVLLAFATFLVVGALIVATFASAHRLAGGVLAAWFASWAWYPTVALVLLFTPLLFPDGRPPSPRWRPVAWLAGATTAAFVVLAAVQPTLELGAGRVANPIGVAAVGNPEDNVPGLVLLDLIGVLVVAAVVSLVVRFRRSRGDERLQLKWFTYACALLPLLVLGDRLPDPLASLLFAVVVSFLPVAAGVAGDPPSWVVAGATLAVAALFGPARRRVQAAVDRQFNRGRYDAARTIEAFSARLRDQVDLDTLAAELLTVVDQTVQPTRSSLWLRP
jgi:hypothetical protein